MNGIPMKPTSLGLSVIVTAMLLGLNVAKADVTYAIDQTIGAGSVVGTIETDGNTGVLSSADIVAWDLTLNGVGASAVITSADFDAAVLVIGSDLTATAAHLYFDYSGTDNGLFVLQDGLYSGNTYYCDATSAGDCLQGATVTPIYVCDPSTQNALFTGNQIIASTSIVTTPEPASLVSMLTALGLLAATLGVRRRQS